MLYILCVFLKCMVACTQRCSITQNSFTTLKTLCTLLTPPCALPPATTGLFITTLFLSFPECRIVRIIQYRAFTDWLLSLSNTHSFQVFSWLHSSFFLVLIFHCLIAAVRRPFTYWRTSSLLPNFHKSEWSCYKYLSAGFCMDTSSEFSWINIKKLLDLMRRVIRFCKKLPNCLPKRLIHFCIPTSNK